MAISSGLGSMGLNINDIRQIIKMDIEASNELQVRIDQLRHDTIVCKKPCTEQIELMDVARKGMTRDIVRLIESMDIARKGMTRDIVRLIESIEGQRQSTPTDREILQALSARLAISDKQSMRLAELRDLTRDVVRASLQPSVQEVEDAELPLGGRPRTPQSPPSGKVCLQPQCAQDARSMSPGPILDAIDGKLERCRRGRLRRSAPVSHSSLRTSARTSAASTVDPVPKPPRSPPEEFYRRAPRTWGGDAVRSPDAYNTNPPKDPTRAASAASSSASSWEHVPVSPVSPERRWKRGEEGRQARYDEEYEFHLLDASSEEMLPDKSTWPLVYRIMDVDPSTPSKLFEPTVRRALTRLARRHDPSYVPHDPEAPVRWAAVSQAYETLIDTEKKRRYDRQHQGPRWFGDFDDGLVGLHDAPDYHL